MQSVRGTRDIFKEEGANFLEIFNRISHFAEKFNFSFLELPIIENSNLFERATGEESDIIQKEIYKFKDRSENSIALRPEFTASVCRFMIENNLLQDIFPKRYFSFGPLFRYERPQAGRYRQFYQANFETFGAKCDIFEISHQLNLIIQILNSLKISDFSIQINHLGTVESRKLFTEELVKYFSNHFDRLSEDSKRRLKTNPLRILDSKEKCDIDLLNNSPKIEDFYQNNELELLKSIINNVQKNNPNIKINIDSNLVRGLDYYSGFIFEIKDLEKNYAMCGGGEYSGLLSKIKGKTVDLESFGFAIGIDRLLLKVNNISKKKDLICFLYCQDETVSEIWQSLLNSDLDLKFEKIKMNKISTAIEKALKLEVKYILIKGENEVNTNKILFKNLETKEQIELDDSSINIDKISFI